MSEKWELVDSVDPTVTESTFAESLSVDASRWLVIHTQHPENNPCLYLNDAHISGPERESRAAASSGLLGYLADHKSKAS